MAKGPAPSGYMGTDDKNPDPGWWAQQIEEAKKYRDKATHQEKWRDWREYYRGDWSGDVMPVNLFYTFLRSTIPRVYFRNPTVSVSPGKPGFLEMAFARVVHRMDNKLLRQMQLKREAKMIVQDAWLFGTGCGKLGFGGIYNATIPVGDDPSIPADKRGHRVEYDYTARHNMPWFLRVHTGQLLVPFGTRDWRSARWVGEWNMRPKEDLENDPRLSNTKDLPVTKHQAMDTGSVDMVEVVEIHDRKTGKVIVLSPYASGKEGKVLLYQDDELQRLTGRPPLFPLQFNPDDENFWAVPDSQILEPHQLEANEINTLIMKHRRLSLVRLGYNKNVVDDEDIAKMLTEEVGAGIGIDGPPQAHLHVFQQSSIPQDLIQAKRELMTDVRETFGFSRNQLGDYQSRRGDTSATEAQNVKESSEVRIDERRDAMADMIREMAVSMNSVVFDRWDGLQVQDIVGPGGARIWVEFDPKQLSLGTYEVRVDPDSAQPRTRAEREVKAAAVYNLLRDNPLVSPEKLTRYVLTEMEGVEFDDLMAALPSPNEAGAERTTPQGLAGMLQAGVQRVQRGQRMLPGPATPDILKGR